MDEQQHTVTHRTSTYPSSLQTAEDVSASLKGAVTAERIRSLADSGYAPHFRIDGGCPLFKLAEVKAWIADNLILECSGRRLPESVRLMYSGDTIGDVFSVPESIRCIEHLKDITNLTALGSGVYLLCSGPDVVYVGQSVNVAMRVPQHCSTKEFDRVFFVPYPADRLNEVEGALIRHLKPRLNGRHSRGAIVGPKPEDAQSTLAVLGFDVTNDNMPAAKNAA